MNEKLVTMAGPNEIDFSKLSNFEVGYIVMDKVAKAIPGLTWGQVMDMGELAAGEKMAGWWTDFTKAVTAPVREVGGMIGDVARTGGGAVMKFLRDEKVQGNINKAYTDFADSGGVAGFWGGSSIFGGGGSGGGEGGGFMDWVNGFLSQLGSEAKAKQAGMGIPGGILPWAIAGSAVLVLIFGKKA